jgi:pSer/pThr/pTyr-binding forkhead associated (FHA) protein
MVMRVKQGKATTTGNARAVNADTIITIGSNATCDLRLDDPSVSGLHAQARIDHSRFLWVRDERSARGMFLNRNDNWIQVRLITACVGDRLRFGDVEVELEQITRLFEDPSAVRLAPTPSPSVFDSQTGRFKLRDPDDDPTFSTPKRNPDTGELEDDST